MTEKHQPFTRRENMKKTVVVLFVALLVLAASTAFADGMLKGIWRAESMEMYVKGQGYKTIRPKDSYLEIKLQEGSLFYGVKHWIRDGRKFSEEFSGAVTTDDRILLQEHEDGQAQGSLLPDGEMVLYYMERGDTPRVHMTRYRKQ